MSTVLRNQSADGCVAATHVDVRAAASPLPIGKPWLSVIMPVYSGERWLEATLESLAAEADDGVEVVLIDSSPSPASREIAGRYSDRLRLRIVQPAKPMMWHAATNLGVDLAHADHICWLHQDDLWLPGRAAAVRSWIETAPEAALHFSPSAIVDASGKRLGTWRCPFRRGTIEPGFGLERLLVQNSIAAPAPVFRKDAWVEVGGLDETLWYSCDWDMWLKLAARGSARYHDQVTTGFRIHGGSQTVSGSRDIHDFERQMQIVLDRHLPRLGDRAAAVRPVSAASIALNGALAAAAAGDLRRLLPAAARAARLGPRGIYRYLRDSRIVERVVPRLRARLAGAL